MGKKEKKSRKGLSTSFANGNGNGEEIDNLEEVNNVNIVITLIKTATRETNFTVLFMSQHHLCVNVMNCSQDPDLNDTLI